MIGQIRAIGRRQDAANGGTDTFAHSSVARGVRCGEPALKTTQHAVILTREFAAGTHPLAFRRVQIPVFAERLVNPFDQASEQRQPRPARNAGATDKDGLSPLLGGDQFEWDVWPGRQKAHREPDENWENDRAIRKTAFCRF